MQRLVAVIKSIALFGARRPFLAVAIGILLVAISTKLVQNLKISTSRRDLVSKDHPLQKRTIEFDEKFGYTNTPAVVVTGGSVEDRRKAVDALEIELGKLPDLDHRVLGRVGPDKVAEVLLLADPEAVAKQIPEGDNSEAAKKLGDGLSGWVSLLDSGLKQGLENDSSTPEQASQGLDRLGTLFQSLDDELAGHGGLTRLADMSPDGKKEYARGLDELGYLSGDGQHNIIALFPQLEGDEGFQLKPVVDEIRAARDRAMVTAAVPEVRADVTGVPALATDELGMVTHDLTVTAIASTLAVVITLYLAFRSFRQAMVSFLPLGFGTIVTFGITTLALGSLNLITASFTSVLLGLGDFGVHIQARYSEFLREGHEPKKALEESLITSGPGLVLTTVTTAVAFLTTMATEFTAFAELGFITSVGLVVMLIGTYLLVPPTLLLLLGKKPRPAPELPGFKALANFVRRWPRAIVVTAVAMTMVFIVWLPQVRFNGRYFEFLPKNIESARGLIELQKDTVVSPFVANVRAGSLDDARDLADKLRALPTVSSVESPSDLVPKLTPERVAALKKIDAALLVDGKPIDFEAAKSKKVDKADLLAKLGSVGDTLDEVAFAMRQAGRDAKPAERAKERLAALKKRVEATSDERLQEVQNEAFDILGRASSTARKVVERGSIAPADLPPLFQHRFVSKDQTEVALFVHPKGDVWDVPTAEAFTKDIETVSPTVSGIATTLAEHPKLIVSGFERATVLAAIFMTLILAISFRRVLDVV
ncbi:MAG TPA: MMPL family transporter, partial [Polyangiaceae bacterium]|nr:MMPL family transporter [Polyangiaceae bacterium]